MGTPAGGRVSGANQTDNGANVLTLTTGSVGTLSGFAPVSSSTSPAHSYTAQFTSSQSGRATIVVATDSFQDPAGNTNQEEVRLQLTVDDAARLSQASAHILPYVTITLGDILNRNFAERIDAAFSGTPQQGLNIRGNNNVGDLVTNTLVNQLKARHNQRLSSTPPGPLAPRHRLPVRPHPHGRSQLRLPPAPDPPPNPQGTPLTQTTPSTAAQSPPLPIITLWGRGFYHDLRVDSPAIDFNGNLSGTPARAGCNAARRQLPEQRATRPTPPDRPAVRACREQFQSRHGFQLRG